MSDNLKKKMIGALAWSSVDRIGQQTIQFVFSIILARLLSPEDYGLMGMVMIFAAISYVLVEGGFRPALIRSKEINKENANTVFFSNFFVACSLYLILFFSAPYIAIFFGQERLVLLVRIVCLAIIFNSFYLIPFAILSKKMDYKMMARINISATIISGSIGITLALLNYGVWALAIQQVSYHFFRMTTFFIWARWLPSCFFSISIFKEIWSFSRHILASSLLSVVFNNIYTFLIGRFYPISQVGFYTQANKMSDTANFTFQSILDSTSYNLFAQIHNDRPRLQHALEKITHHAALITIPIGAFLIASATPLFYTVLGEKWLFSVIFFQLICTANLLFPTYYINNNALNSIGRSKTTFYIELTKRIIITFSILICFDFTTFEFRYEINMLLLGYIIAHYFAYLLGVFLIKKHLKIYYKHQLKILLLGICIGICIASCCFASSLFINNIYILFLSNLLSSLIIYILLLRQFSPDAWNYLIDQLTTVSNMIKTNR